MSSDRLLSPLPLALPAPRSICHSKRTPDLPSLMEKVDLSLLTLRRSLFSSVFLYMPYIRTFLPLPLPETFFPHLISWSSPIHVPSLFQILSLMCGFPWLGKVSCSLFYAPWFSWTTPHTHTHTLIGLELFMCLSCPQFFEGSHCANLIFIS